MVKYTIMFIGLVILYFWSLSFQVKKKEREFKKKIADTHVFYDPLIDQIYSDFIIVSNFDVTGQDVSIKLVKFPYVYSWYNTGIKDQTGVYSDAAGIALGMGVDDKIDIYLNYNDWKTFGLDEKRKLIYHELLHDCYNLEHDENLCDIMYPYLNSCSDADLNDNLSNIITIKKLNKVNND